MHRATLDYIIEMPGLEQDMSYIAEKVNRLIVLRPDQAGVIRFLINN